MLSEGTLRPSIYHDLIFINRQVIAVVGAKNFLAWVQWSRLLCILGHPVYCGLR